MRCITPFYVEDKIKQVKIPVPCGKCPPCLKRRVSGWSFRLTQEGKICSSAHFVTLTYNTDHVPITKNGFMSLDRKAVPLFMKRLRYLHGGKSKLKYYVCGEYGGKFNRPHYHILLFNSEPSLITKAWALSNKALGNTHFGNFTIASIGYTLKYMCKPSRIPMHARDDRVKEFSLMSKGLGSCYCTPAMKKWHLNDLTKRMYCNLPDGKKIAMPRYYKDRMYTEKQRKRIANACALDNIARDEKEQARLIAQYGADASRVVMESHIYQFQKMYNDSEKGRNKIGNA